MQKYIFFLRNNNKKAIQRKKTIFGKVNKHICTFCYADNEAFMGIVFIKTESKRKADFIYARLILIDKADVQVKLNLQ